MWLSQEYRRRNIAPHMVRFGLSTWCNYNCSMCCWVHSPYRDNGIPLENIDYDILLDTLTYLYENGTKVLLFSGVWEPFNHPRIYNILSYVSDKFELYMQTNISLIRESKFNDIEFQSLDMSVNFNAVSEKAYKYIYSNQPYSNLLKIISKIHYLKSRWVWIKLIFIVSKLNYFDIPALLKLVSKINVQLHLEFSNELGDGNVHKIMLSPDKKKEIIKTFQEHLDKYPEIKDNINSEHFINQWKGFRTWLEKITKCNVWYMYARIEENGNIYPCNNTTSDYLMWNINKQKFSEIWKSNMYNSFKEAIYQGKLLNTCCQNNAVANGGNYKLRMFVDETFD